MTTHEASSAPERKASGKRRSAGLRIPRVSLTMRLIVLVLIAVLPAIVIQAYNEYELRKAREADIRQQVVQITKQFGEEIGELREGARQLLLALSQLTPVRSQEGAACSALFAHPGIPVSKLQFSRRGGYRGPHVLLQHRAEPLVGGGTAVLQTGDVA